MPVGPILPGRIPSSLLAERLSQDLSRNNRLLNRLQDQVATGQKLFRPSEAPAAALRTIINQRQLEYQEQYQVTIETDRSFLSASEQSLQSISDLLNHSKSLLLAGVGENATSEERIALADEVAAALQGAVNAANSTHRGRYLFGGSETSEPPFQIRDDDTVLYTGDRFSTVTLIEQHLRLANSTDGDTAFDVLRSVSSADLNPALSTETPLEDLHNGLGVSLGTISVIVQGGATTSQADVDLTSAKTLGDVASRIEAAFAGGPITVTVDFDPATNSGFRITPASGTVSVVDQPGSRVAEDLGIASGPSAQILGDDLDPILSESTLLSDLNGGTGIGPVAGNGLQITQGERVATVDLTGLDTLEDLFNAIHLTGLDVDVGLNDEQTGIRVASRLSGVDFSVGENNGTNATQLGIRTFTGGTLLADLNGGLGVPTDAAGGITIDRRDGTTVEIDVAGSRTIDDVLAAINAVDPGVLTATLNPTGNGIQILDNDGVSTGPLLVRENEVTVALGINGEETGTDPTVALTGRDTNPQESGGLFNILSRLESALRNNDVPELERLDGLLEDEIGRFNLVQGEIGGRLRLLDQTLSRIQDREILIQESLSIDLDTDLTETITQVAQVQAALEATLRIAAQTSQLTLLAFL